MTLQRLSSKSLIKVTTIADTTRKSREKFLQIELLTPATGILSDLATVEYDFDNARFDGFTTDELVEYQRLSGKIKENIQKTLT